MVLQFVRKEDKMKKKLNRLKSVRQGYGLKIKQVCKDTNISYSSMRQYEGGYRTPRLETMKILSDYYHKSINELFLETSDDYFERVKNADAR